MGPKRQLNLSAESSATGSGSGHTQLMRSAGTTTSITTPAVQVRRQYNDSSAGLRIVSSDGKTFYVDLEIVRAAGNRLLERQRIKIEEGHADVIEIILHNEELERSDVVLDLLNLYYRDPFPHFNSWDKMMHLRQVIRLAQSLDSQATLDTISATLQLRLLENRDDRNWPFGTFVLSSTMDNMQLCSAAISKARDLSWRAGLNPNPDDQTASFRLISSNDVAFYVDRAYIAGHSRVLNDMLKVSTGSGSSPELRFADLELEHSSVLELLLDLWHGLPLPDIFEHLFPFPAFRLLATLEDVQGCAIAIRNASNWHWLGQSDLGASTPLDSFVQKWSAFDVASWSMKDFRNIPQHFTLALMRATIAAKRPLWKDTDWKTADRVKDSKADH
ncbi:hypothetical protein JCM24511_05770 [Saitozyma sp. JCM 24511]|nr:hypothetical protein JCM24511_05770 [Saitozyma sp. JCM 24511]